MQRNVTDGDITELVDSTAEAASAYIRGDIRRYLELIKHGWYDYRVWTSRSRRLIV